MTAAATDLEGALYVGRPVVIRAGQWTDAGRPPAGVDNVVIDEHTGTAHRCVYTHHGTVTASLGDYLTAELNGNRQPVEGRYYPINQRGSNDGGNAGTEQTRADPARKFPSISKKVACRLVLPTFSISEVRAHF